MFKDTERELKRLEEELLEETQKIPTDTDELLRQLHEELDEPPAEPQEPTTPNPAPAPTKDSLKGLAITAVLLTLGIVGIVVWWAIRLLG